MKTVVSEALAIKNAARRNGKWGGSGIMKKRSAREKLSEFGRYGRRMQAPGGDKNYQEQF